LEHILPPGAGNNYDWEKNKKEKVNGKLEKRVERDENMDRGVQLIDYANRNLNELMIFN